MFAYVQLVLHPVLLVNYEFKAAHLTERRVRLKVYDVFDVRIDLSLPFFSSFANETSSKCEYVYRTHKNNVIYGEIDVFPLISFTRTNLTVYFQSSPDHLSFVFNIDIKNN